MSEADDELRRTIASLEEAARRMDEFLGVMAHELRNPLTPIRNAVSVMRMKTLTDPSLRWARDTIERQVEQLAGLVDGLLDVSRIASGRLTLRREPVEMAVAVSRACEEARPSIVERGHELEVALPEDPALVEGDLARIEQVLAILLSNATRFTPEHGRIVVSLATSDGWAVVGVRDTGIGIPLDMLSRLFDLTQSDRSLERIEGGLGIGLTVAQRLVALHGGTIEARSAGPGKGSEFEVRLPLTRSLPVRRARRRTAPEPSEPRRVLVVDDSRDAADSIAMLLNLDGHEVHVAYDGPSAITLAMEKLPQVVLLDIGLSGTNGYEVARRMREIFGDKKLVLVAVTGYDLDEDRARTHEAGFDYHLVKPVDPTVLATVLRHPVS